MKVELFLVPIAVMNEKLCVLVKPFADKYAFPRTTLAENISLREAVSQIIQEMFISIEPSDLDSWLKSPRCKDRIVDVYDGSFLFENKPSTAVVKTIAIPWDFATHAQGIWMDAKMLLSKNSNLIDDYRPFLKEIVDQIPMLIKNTSFIFELLSKVFSIQDLRLLISMISNHEVDPGNFHRRLKRLDILRPLETGQQRVHRWEFAWDRSDILAEDGLIP